MGSRQQDKIVKVQEPSERMGGEKKESSPMYLRVVGRKKDRNTLPAQTQEATCCGAVVFAQDITYAHGRDSDHS